MGMFRELTADDIEVRVSQVHQYGVELLLYKTSRVDADILDETIGPMGWQCRFEDHKGTLFCSVGIMAQDGTWVWKSDAGKPSNMEAQKGEASDAFKRACFKWGIGRELYTSPRIKVALEKCAKIRQGKNGKMQCYDDFRCEKVRVERGRMTAVSIFNDTTGHRCFVWMEGGADGEQ